MINWLAVGKAVHTDGSTRIAVKKGNEVRFINLPAGAHPGLTSVLHAENPAALAASLRCIHGICARGCRGLESPHR